MYFFSSKILVSLCTTALLVAAQVAAEAKGQDQKTLLNFDLDALFNWTELDSIVNKLNPSNFVNIFTPESVNLAIQLKNKVLGAKSLYEQSSKKVYTWCSSVLPARLDNLRALDSSTNRTELIDLLNPTLHDGAENFNSIMRR